MTSPLLEFYNTILILPGAETLGTDRLGNPSLISGSEVEYKAFLKAKQDPNTNYSVGVNSQTQYFSGYVVEPKALPDNLELPYSVKCRIRRGNSNIWVEGTLEISPRYISVDIPEQVLGDAIAGYFFTRK